MKIFTGLITETNSRKVAVIAETKEEANAMLSDLYYNGDIDELNDDDYDGWDSEIDDEVTYSAELDDIKIYDEDGNEYEKDNLPEKDFDFEEV
ncbi:DpnD/PcfM family protein [Blautia intestinalis]|uniref:DpnD/PcfM family protein n=1 Tax=Blautia intestinalis TaxID=2763028 RepID=UPI0022E16BCD|nr:DpnD/PcfM family protein [Blautia intestinalis]